MTMSRIPRTPALAMIATWRFWMIVSTETENNAMLSALVKVGLACASTAGLGCAAAGVGVLTSAGQKSTAPASYKALTRAAPDTRLTMQWGDLTFLTPVQRNTYAPAWRTQFLVPKNTFESTPARIDAVDDDDGADDDIGTQLCSPKDLLGSSVIHLKFGSVTDLVLQIDKVMEEDAPAEKKVSIGGSKRWIDTGLAVLGSQTVQITATGETCLGGECFSAAGDPDQSVKLGDLTLNVGQLAAMVGDDLYPVAPAGSFTVRSGGRLALGIARGTVSSGGLEATARVFYPVTTRTAR